MVCEANRVLPDEAQQRNRVDSTYSNGYSGRVRLRINEAHANQHADLWIDRPRNCV
jgi:hypothetical protein